MLAHLFSIALTAALAISSARSRSITTPTILEGPSTNQEWEWSCSIGCAIGWTVDASSRRESIGRFDYGADKLDDARTETAWVEGGEGMGYGERFVYRFPDSVFGDGMDCVSFWGVRIINGYTRNDRTWSENGRVKWMRIDINGRPAAFLHLLDTPQTQEVMWDALGYLRRGDSISFEIVDVYRGTKYEDVAISEILLHGAH